MKLLRRMTGAFTTPWTVTFCDACAQVCDNVCRQTVRERDLARTVFRSR